MIFGKSINKYYIQNLHWFLIGIFFIALIDYMQVQIPGLVSDVFAGLTAQTMSQADVVDIILEMALYIAIIMVGRVIWRLTIITSSRRFDYGLRNDMFEHATKLSNQYY